MRIVLTGGATGGHTTPFLPVIDVLRKQEREVELFFVGAVTPYVRELFATYDIPAQHIPAGKWRRYHSWLNIFDACVRLPLSIIFALGRLWWLMPDVVLSKGGYGSLPVVFAAWLYRIPLLIHESDVVPGLANRLGARLATVIAVNFEEARAHFGRYRRQTIVTGIPVRFDLTIPSSSAAKETFGWTAQDTVVLITGGSQGAAQINEVTLKILPQLVTEAHVIHLTGPDHFATVAAVAEQLLAESAYKLNYQVYPGLTDRMAMAMSAADIIVSRAGATTLAEIAHLHKPSLLIPLPGSAQNNQRLNAAIFERRGAARVLDADNVGPHLFHRSLEELIASPALRESLAQRVATLDHPRAARDIADLTVKLAQGLVPAYTR